MNKIVLDEISKIYQKENVEFSIIQNIKSGKEANVYKVNVNGLIYALKVYKDQNVKSFCKNQIYLDGKYYKKNSENKAIAKKNKFGNSLKFENWIKREYFLMKKLYESNIKIPKPIKLFSKGILMEYIGKNMPAPKLKDYVFTDRVAHEKCKQTILYYIDIMWNIGIVHSDLSEYNILIHDQVPYIIDLPQAVDIRNNPNADKLKQRDISNILNFFNNYY